MSCVQWCEPCWQCCVPHQHTSPVTQSWPGRSGGDRQCQFGVFLQCGCDLAEFKYPTSSLAPVLGHPHAAKPFWAEGCPAGCTLLAVPMVRGSWTHLSRHWLAYSVPLPASTAPAPCKYSPGVFMCKHYLMGSCSESHGKAADFPPCWSPQQHQAGRESPALNVHFLS